MDGNGQHSDVPEVCAKEQASNDHNNPSYLTGYLCDRLDQHKEVLQPEALLIIQHSDDEVLTHACQAFVNLTEESEVNIQKVIDVGAVPQKKTFTNATIHRRDSNPGRLGTS